MTAILVVTALACRAAPVTTCADSIFRGFDSRLKVIPIGRLGDTAELPVGFEMVNGRAVIAFSHRVLVLRAETIATMPSLDQILGIAVDSSSTLRLQTNKGIQLLGAERFEPDTILTSSVKGRIFGSGEDSFVETLRTAEDNRLSLTTPKGRFLPLFRAEGEFRIGSWNAVGLAAIINNRLLAWEKGASQLTLLAVDKGLEQARDVVLVGPHRSVVSLPHATILVTADTKIVLFGSSTRCRWINGVLYLLDLQSGIVWSIEGLEQIGTAKADESHARALLSDVPKVNPETSAPFLEAARIVGCAQARGWKQQLDR